MANIVEGGPARVVPLVYYDDNGNRYVVGKVKAKLRQGKLHVISSAEDGVEAFEVNIDTFDYEPIEEPK